MIYKNLCLSAGGGILNQKLLAEQSGDSTLFIGLSETGIDCLKDIKKRI